MSFADSSTSTLRKYRALDAMGDILGLLRGDWRTIFVILVYAIGVGLCSLVVPVAVKSLVNTVAFGTLLQPVIVLTFIVGGVLIFAGIMRVLQLAAVEIIQRRLVVRLGLSLADRLPHIHRERFLQRYGPEYVLRFLEVFQVQKVLSVLLLDGIALFFQVLLGLTLVSFYHPLFLAFALVLIMIVLVVFSILGIGAVHTSVKESDAKYEVASWLQDLASDATAFKSITGEIYAKKRADALLERYLTCRKVHFYVVLRQVVAGLLLQAIASSLLLGLGGWLVIRGQLTLGQLVAAELVFSIVLLSISKIGKHLESFYDLAAGVNKLDAILDLPAEDLSGTTMPPNHSPARLRIEGVTLHPSGSATPSLVNAHLEIAPGSKVAVWGENGSGKSFLSNLIYRLATSDTGRVRIDEHNVASIHPQQLRNEVALIRDIELFHGSIKDNLTLGNDAITEDMIRSTLQLVGLAEEVYALPKGIETMLKGTQEPLSRGQALRLMVARGLLAQPRLLVLDGTLDLIDERSRMQMLKAILDETYLCTVVVLTHDISLLPHFRCAYKMHNGTFVYQESP